MHQKKSPKKVGIVTRYDDNYGACLQAAALQKALAKLDVSCETIQINNPTNSKKQKGFNRLFSLLFKLGLGNFLDIFLSKKFINARKNAFNKFRKNHIILSQEKYTLDNLATLSNKYDAYICGSDMIWCEEFLPLLEAYFLSFAPKKKRIAFSPSFGRPFLEECNEEKYTNYINGMEHLACREESGIKIIKKLTDRDAVHTIDPTFLLTKQEWIDLIPEKKDVSQSSFVFRYMFTSLNSTAQKTVNQICRALHSDIRYIPSNFREYIKEKKNGILGHGPYTFLNFYKDCKFVVTNTFHGLVFALIFEKPFIVFKREDSGTWAKYDDRLFGLLSKLNLEDRYVSQNDPFQEEWLRLDYSSISPLLAAWREDSLNYLSKSLNAAFSFKTKEKSSEITMPFSQFNEKTCVGCSACENICPTKSIKMIKNNEGFFYPTFNRELCINCGACERVCQLSDPSSLLNQNPPLSSFCAISKKHTFWKTAASGGLSGEIARYVLSQKNAFVCGCVMDENQQVKHEIITDETLLHRFSDSKYVQSNLLGIFEKIKKNLEFGMNGVFFGTPCQVASLKKFLGNTNVENLLTVDIICHGVPSPLFFEKARDYYKSFSSKKIQSFRFRNKIGPFLKNFFGYKIKFDDGKTLKIPAKCDAYYNLFLEGKTFRESCYNCSFATLPRCSDITIGDCDSSTHYKRLYGEKTKSTVIINTQKGQTLFSKIEKEVSFLSLDLKREAEVNHQLREPFNRPEKRNDIYQEVNTLSYRDLNKKYAKKYNKKQKFLLFLQEVLPHYAYRTLLKFVR